MNDKKKVKTYEDYTDYLDKSSSGAKIVADIELLIKRELHFFKSDENKDKDGLLKKVGSNDEGYKAVIRNLKYSCIEADEAFIDEIEKYFIDKLVTELMLEKLWKKSTASFESKIHYNLDYIGFKEAQFKKGRLIKDDEHFIETGKTRYVAIDPKTNKRYSPNLNWTCLDLEEVPEEVTEEK